MQDTPPKQIFGLLSLFVLVLGFTLLFIHFSTTIKDEPVEETILLKNIKKGLYLYPRYEVLVTNSDRPAMITKEQYESISIGEKISGFKKNADTFVTEKNIQFEISLGMILLPFLYLVMFAIVGKLLEKGTFFNKSTKRKNLLQTFIKVNIYGFAFIYIIVGMTLTVLTATNIFHKMNKWNQTEVEATVLGGDFNTTRSYRGGTHTTYELFLRYEDTEGTNHITRKGVSQYTYNTYDVDESIPIVYRNNNEYDTFIQTKSIQEILSAFLNIFVFIITAYLVSLFFIIRKWLRLKRNDKQADQGDQEDAQSTI